MFYVCLILAICAGAVMLAGADAGKPVAVWGGFVCFLLLLVLAVVLA